MVNTWLTPAKQFVVAEQIESYFRIKGWSRASSCAMVTMAEEESSFRVDALGDKDTAYSLFQLHKDRCAVIKDGCGIDLTDLEKITVTNALDAIWWEMHNVPLWKSSMASIVLPAIDAFTAGYNATKNYERPGNHKDWAARGQRCEFWFTYFTNLANNEKK